MRTFLDILAKSILTVSVGVFAVAITAAVCQLVSREPLVGVALLTAVIVAWAFVRVTLISLR